MTKRGGGPALGAQIRRNDHAHGDETLLSKLYETVGASDKWRPFLDALSQSFGNGLGCVAVHDFKRDEGFTETPTSARHEFAQAYEAYYSRLNPWIKLAGHRPAGSLMESDAILPFAELVKTEFYNDWCRPQGIAGGIGLTVEQNDRRMMNVTVLMSRRSLDEQPDAIDRLQRLRPHLLRVAQLNRHLASLEARAMAAEGALDRLATAMLVLSSAGQVLSLTPLADRIMAAGDGITLRGGKLEAHRSDETQVLRGLIAAATACRKAGGVQPGGMMAVHRQSGRKPYEVLVAPLAETTVNLGFAGPLIAVFIREPEASVSTPVEWLRQIYRLTAAEARLMQALIAGHTIDEISARFTIGRETVRSQLKAVFRKTGATSQNELIRLGISSLAALHR